MNSGSWRGAGRPSPRSRPQRTGRFLRALLLLLPLFLLRGVSSGADPEAPRLQRVRYQHPGQIVDLGVGLYGCPLPLDWDHDGDLDLIVSCPDRPYNGAYLFENPGPSRARGAGARTVFRAGRRLGPGPAQATLSWVNGRPRLLAQRQEFTNFLAGDLQNARPIYPTDTLLPMQHRRANVWRLADFDGDGASDLLVGQGNWDDFGWFDRNEWWKHYDAQGRWTAGLPRGWVFWIRNVGTDAEPRWGEPRQLRAGEQAIETLGWPGPNLADFDRDGDLDLICGEFLDGLTWFENVGTRRAPRFAPGRRLVTTQPGHPELRLDLQMIFPQAVDWDGDGDVDLLVGDEDGRVALVENAGRVREHMPLFRPPVYLRQEADEVKFGALATPVGFDWDGDGDIDLLSGNTAGYVGFIENLSGPGVERPKFAAPRLLQAAGRTIRIQAGPNGSIQGPIEAKWGYTTLSVADWDGDGLPDLLVNSIWGKVVWYRNEGSRRRPALAAARPIEVEWPGPPPKPAWNWWRPQGRELVTQWRTTPCAIDWNRDGLVDLVMLDPEGYLALYPRARRAGRLVLLPPERCFADETGQPLRLNAGTGGKSGRRKLCVTDWNGDGNLDFLVNSKNANVLRQVGQRDGRWLFHDDGPLAPDNLEAHDVSPTTVDWDGNGVPDFVGGGEDGHFYYLRNGRAGR